MKTAIFGALCFAGGYVFAHWHIAYDLDHNLAYASAVADLIVKRWGHVCD